MIENTNNMPNGLLYIFRSTFLKQKIAVIEHLLPDEKIVHNPGYIELDYFNIDQIDNHWQVTLQKPIQGHQHWFVSCQDATIFINRTILNFSREREPDFSRTREPETIPPDTKPPIDIPRTTPAPSGNIDNS